MALAVIPAQAQTSPEIQRGLGWLQAQVQADGSLAGAPSAVRLGIDRILKEAQWRWVLAQPAGNP